MGDLQLKVALQSDVGDEPMGAPAIISTGKGPPALESALAQLPKRTKGMVVRVDSARQAHWFLRVRGDQVILVPAEGLSVAPRSDAAVTEAAPAFLGGSLKDEQALASELATSLRRIARSRSLLSLANANKTDARRRVQAAVSMLKHEGRFARSADCPRDVTSAMPVEYGQTGRIVRAGTCVWFVVKNDSRDNLAADMAFLFVDSHHKITPLFPRASADNPVPAGRELRLGPYLVDATTTGLEHVVAIAVRGGEVRTDFSILAQEGLKSVPRGAPGGTSELWALLATALHGEGQTRTISTRAETEYDVQTVSWTTAREPPD